MGQGLEWRILPERHWEASHQMASAAESANDAPSTGGTPRLNCGSTRQWERKRCVRHGDAAAFGRGALSPDVNRRSGRTENGALFPLLARSGRERGGSLRRLLTQLEWQRPLTRGPM